MSDIKQKGIDEMFCPSCGAIVKKEAVLCVHCGVSLKASSPGTSINSRWLTSLLLCIFLGGLGIHRFYNKKILRGIITLLLHGGIIAVIIVEAIKTPKFEKNHLVGFYKSNLTLFESSVTGLPAALIGFTWLALVIWWIVDLILIITGKYKGPDKKCILLKD